MKKLLHITFRDQVTHKIDLCQRDLFFIEVASQNKLFCELCGSPDKNMIPELKNRIFILGMLLNLETRLN